MSLFVPVKDTCKNNEILIVCLLYYRQQVINEIPIYDRSLSIRWVWELRKFVAFYYSYDLSEYMTLRYETQGSGYVFRFFSSTSIWGYLRMNWNRNTWTNLNSKKKKRKREKNAKFANQDNNEIAIIHFLFLFPLKKEMKWNELQTESNTQTRVSFEC